MEPTPETEEAFDELGPDVFDDQLPAQLLDMAARVRDIVPDCLGLSVCYLEEGLAFTLVATDHVTAVLDAAQYLAGGPCVEAAATGRVVQMDEDDLLDERSWQIFAEATAATDVRCSLSLPVVTGERVTGSVNLYAASPEAFTGHHQELAEIFGAWAPGAITNADLSFSSRLTAAATPQRLRDQALVDTAVGILAAYSDLDVTRAEQKLLDAAARAGVTDVQLAKALIELRTGRRRDDRPGRPE